MTGTGTNATTAVNGNGSGAGGFEGVSIEELPKSSVYTSSLIPDPQFPTPESSREAPKEKLGPRQVRNAHFTWVEPEGAEPRPELLAVSDAALKTLGIRKGEEKREEFVHLMAGNRIVEGIMPWASAYGGWQFGSWAGQLGDGRAISIFEATNPETKERYELQLKGAGLTPYSRFADGKAVLRSSLREFVVSEYLHAIGIPTTRALSLTLLPHKKAVRERIEPCAIVCRFAPSWIRIGSFDLFRSRGDRTNLRRLADYVIEQCFGGEKKLIPNHAEDEGMTGAERPNRYYRMFREVTTRNARTVAKWQSYGFMNGVLNTDNTSIMGLSLDFGPFSFMDNFDPNFTPNHDDYMRRYSYSNQPTVIWWNLVRLAEDLAELLASGDNVDDPAFVANGTPKGELDALITRAEALIEAAGEEYKAVFTEEYRRTMCARLGFATVKDSDVEDIIPSTLEILRTLELDFNHFFRYLGKIPIKRMEEKDQWTEAARGFLQSENTFGECGAQKAAETIAEWLGGVYRERLLVEEKEGAGRNDEERKLVMNAVNPNFVPRAWLLQEIIGKVEKKRDREVLPGLMRMVLEPFRDEWGWDPELEQKYTGEPPKPERGLQCSCSS